jgi:hypothetical protein
VLLHRQQAKLARGTKDKERAMSQTSNTAIAVIGIDIGKNSFHVVGHEACREATCSTQASMPKAVHWRAGLHLATRPLLPQHDGAARNSGNTGDEI